MINFPTWGGPEGRPNYLDRIIMHESLSGVQSYAAVANYVDASPVAGLAEWQRTPMVMLLLLLLLNFASALHLYGVFTYTACNVSDSANVQIL